MEDGFVKGESGSFTKQSTTSSLVVVVYYDYDVIRLRNMASSVFANLRTEIQNVNAF